LSLFVQHFVEQTVEKQIFVLLGNGGREICFVGKGWNKYWSNIECWNKYLFLLGKNANKKLRCAERKDICFVGEDLNKSWEVNKMTGNLSFWRFVKETSQQNDFFAKFVQRKTLNKYSEVTNFCHLLGKPEQKPEQKVGK